MTPETRSLLRAAAVGDRDLVKSLIALGTDVNCVSAAGQTPLMLAAGFGHEGIVKVLLESGAFVGATDELGLTAADWAANFPQISKLISPETTEDEDDDEGTGPSERSNGQQQIIARLTAQRMQEATRQRFEKPEPRVTLGGLAGAILRERVAKSNSLEEHHEPGVDQLPPPAPPPRAFADVTAELDSSKVEPVVDSLIDLEESPAARGRVEPLIGYPVTPEESVAPTSQRVFNYPFEPEEPVADTAVQTDPIGDYPFGSEEPVATSQTAPLEDYPVESEESVAASPTAPLEDYSVESEESVDESPTEPLEDYPVESEEPVAASPTESLEDYPAEAEEPVAASPTESLEDYPVEAEEPVAASSTESLEDYPGEWAALPRSRQTADLVDDEREWVEPVASTSESGESIAEYDLEADDPTASTNREVPASNNYPVEFETPKIIRKRGVIDYPEEYEDHVDEFEAADDDTLSRAGVRTTDDTSPSVPQNRQRRESSFQSLGLSEAPPARISKVQVNVAPKARQGSTRTLIWILVILFLGGGAYAGYRLSSYFLNSSNPPEATVTPKAESQPQPPVGPVKAAPVVGGELAGTELFVPDAEYPTAAAPQSGVVVVHVRVNPRGMVLSAEATEGEDRFIEAAEQAGKQAAFSPEKLRGKGQVVGGTITYTFIAPTTTATATDPSTSTAAPEAKSESPQVGGPLAGTEVNVPQPDYPAAARSRNITGTVTIVVRVSRAGRVVSWRTLDGDNVLRPAALRAAKAATFDPRKLPGTGEVVGTITFTFRGQ